MAVEFDSDVDLYDGGILYGKIGVSKRIDQYTFDEISDFLYAGVSTEQFKNYQTSLTGVYMNDCTAPIKIVDPGGTDLDAQPGEGDDTGDCYCKVIWCYSPIPGTPLINIDSISITDTGVYIITNMDASNIVIKMTTTRTADWGSDWQTRQASSFSDEGKAMDFTPECYWQDNGAANFNPGAADTHRHLITSIAPFLLVPAGNSFVLLNAVFARMIGGGTGPIITLTPDLQYNYLTCVDNSKGSFAPVCTPTEPTSQTWYAYGMEFYAINSAGDNYSLLFFFNESSRYYHWRYVPNTHEKLLMYMIRSGVYIYTDQIYKPVISGGYISGYTDDTSAQSDIDNYTYVNGNKHDVPPSPPPPTPPNPDEDNDDPISTNDAPFGAGIAHYYVTTAGSVILNHVSEALGTWDIDTSKKDLYRNLISCKLIKPPAAIPTSGSENFTIYGVQPQYQGSPVLLPVVSGNPSATFGSYSISRKFNDFRDFAPYSKAEIFLPYCGWTALPSHVIGRSVSVKYFTDIIAATCKALVFCGNNVVAEAAGIIGLDIPFASENVGAKMEAANMGLLASTLGAVQTAVGVGTMVSTKSGSGMKNVTSGLSQVISGCTQISMAGNENWTEINGKAGDGCSLSGIDTIIIKITRPKYGSNGAAPYVPSGYAHNIGYVAMKQTKPGNVTGLLVCDNVDASGISGATQRERELIKAYLESGIIVNAAPTP